MEYDLHDQRMEQRSIYNIPKVVFVDIIGWVI